MFGILIVLALPGLGLIALVIQKRWPRARRIAGNLLLSYAAVVMALGGAELFMRYATADSATPMQWTLAGQNWMRRYIQRNSLGYRDREWTTGELSARTTVLVVGDSFTEGWGIENPADRFSDVLGQMLGDDYAVVNLGIGGTSTLDQLQILEEYPYQQPDVIIWQYLLNDIYVAAESNGSPWNVPVPDVPPLAQESHLANYLYWRLYTPNLYRDPATGQTQWEWLYSAYDNAYIWDIHHAEIDRLIDYAERVNARLITLIFPNMEDPTGSIPYVDRVAQAVEARGHTDILRLFDAAASWPPETRLVSNRDAHPSAAFNHYVAALIYKQFFEGSG
jgi:lysophospholipase L1-like esterase